jgi:transcriptional regulator PpsR
LPAKEGGAIVSQQDKPWPRLRGRASVSAKTLIGLGADVVLLLDSDGIILDLACSGGERLPDEVPAWMGKEWASTVSADSRHRLAGLLNPAGDHSRTWVQIRHVSSRGAQIPVQYRALSLGASSGPVIAVGREMVTVASLQQQLIDAQQALEQDYWHFREMETRYRLLFRMISDGILVVETGSLRVVESNPAADGLIAPPGKRLVGHVFADDLEPPGEQLVREMLGRLVPGAQPASVRVRRRGETKDLTIDASLVQQAQSDFYLVRVVQAGAPESGSAAEGNPSVEEAVASAPDCILLTDEDGHLSAANPAFFSLAQLPPGHRVKGTPLERWLGRPGIDVRVLISNLRKYGSIRLFRTVFRGEVGAITEVEVSAAAVGGNGRRHLGFFIRDVARRLHGQPAGEGGSSSWLEELTERVGQAPLKDLVRESTEQIERLCIETALRLTDDNRASAAELLGLSRQSLYVKLARYDLGGSSRGGVA